MYNALNYLIYKADRTLKLAQDIQCKILHPRAFKGPNLSLLRSDHSKSLNGLMVIHYLQILSIYLL